jgi:hypothetical protein
MSMPPTLDSANLLPEVVMGYVSIRSQGGTSFLDADDLSDPEPFYGGKQDAQEAARAIEGAGLGASPKAAWARRWQDLQARTRNSPAAA